MSKMMKRLVLYFTLVLISAIASSQYFVLGLIEYHDIQAT